MGMVGGLTQVTPEELKHARRDPKLLVDMVSEISALDASRTCDLDKAWHGVHYLLVGDAGRREEKLWVLPLYIGIFASTFIVSAVFGRLLVINGAAQATSGFLYRVLAAVGMLSFVGFGLFGLLWLRGGGMRLLRMAIFRRHLRAQAFVVSDAVRKVMLGGTSLGSIAYYVTPEEVRLLAPMLGAISDDEIRHRFDPARMRAMSIYLFRSIRHTDESWFGYALEHCRRVIAFYADAARRGNAVVFSVSV